MNILLETLQNIKNPTEVPVAALIVDNISKKILSIATNQVILQQDPTAHAELLAIRQACQLINNYRLYHHSLFVTLEPCPMCAGAILQTKIPKLYFGAFDKKYGAIESKIQLFQQKYPHKIEIYGGIAENSCKQLLQDFFKSKR